jgi:hypothetical protein
MLRPHCNTSAGGERPALPCGEGGVLHEAVTGTCQTQNINTRISIALIRHRQKPPRNGSFTDNHYMSASRLRKFFLF